MGVDLNALINAWNPWLAFTGYLTGAVIACTVLDVIINLVRAAVAE